MKAIYTGTKKEHIEYQYSDLDELLQQSDIVSLNIKAHKAPNLLSKEKL